MSNELVKATEKSGTKISKEKLIELLKASNLRELSFSKGSNGFATVAVPMK